MRFYPPPSLRAVAFGLCFACSFAGQNPADAQGDAKAGRAKAGSVCVVCHGVDGLAKIPEAPNLAGQNENYLIAQLQAFKSGDRKNEMMSVVSQTLSDADIENLAAYYSAIEISVGKTPAQ
ncbi:MAG TPA: cytochrome c [Roseiarcus sp.]|nr:cytochrome c [Roseiarcus sp.]